MTGTFLTTNERYVIPIPREADDIPIIPNDDKGEVSHAPLTQALQAKLTVESYRFLKKVFNRNSFFFQIVVFRYCCAKSQQYVRMYSLDD